MSIDVQRLDDVFLRLRRALYATILRIVRNSAEAEELTQDAYLRARRAVDETTPRNLEAFLWQTARNLALDHVRHQKVRSSAECLGVNEAALSRVPDQSPSIEDHAIHKEMLRAFTEALLRLPPRAQRVWHLSRVEGLPYPEIAKRLDVSPNTVFNDMKMAMGVLLEIRERINRQ